MPFKYNVKQKTPGRTGILLIAVVMLCTVYIPASGNQSREFAPDSSEVNVRMPEAESLGRYAEDPEFRYDDAGAPGESLIGMLWFELVRFLSRLFGAGEGNTVMKIVMVLLLAAAILLVLNRVLSGEIRSVFTGKSASESVRSGNGDTIKKGRNLDIEIDRMVRQENYREAVRLLYRKALKELSEEGLISWSAEKTNHDYLLEARSHSVSKPLGEMTRIYDYIEYGDFGIQRSGYERVQAMYEKLRGALNDRSGENS